MSAILAMSFSMTLQRYEIFLCFANISPKIRVKFQVLTSKISTYILLYASGINRGREDGRDDGRDQGRGDGSDEKSNPPLNKGIPKR